MTAIYRAWDSQNLSPIGNVGIGTTAGQFRSNFAHCAFLTTVGAAQYNRWRLPAYYGVTASGSFWFSAEVVLNGFAVFASAFILQFTDALDRPRLGLQWDGTSHFGFKTVSAGGVDGPLLGSLFSVPVSTLFRMDMFIDLSATGSLLVYVNQDLVSSANGDTAGGLTTVNGFEISGPCAWSEIIWDTDDTRTWSLATQDPTVAGNVDQWTGTFHDVIDESDNTVNYTPNPNLIQEYGVNGLPAGTWNVVDTTLAYRAANGGTGPQHIEGVRRTHAADYATASTGPGLGWRNIWDVSPINPATGVAWTQGELNAPGYNIGVGSLT